MVKIRTFPKDNYRGIYCGGKTIRIALDPSKPITELEFPEFYDVKITNKCFGGCPWCYQDSRPSACHAENVIEKTMDFFGAMTPEQRPFQVAIGGGEPTLHPDFIDLLSLFDYYDIVPNYTTNGMHLTPEILDATKTHCGGVAVSCHPHLNWEAAVKQLMDHQIFTNLHIIISGPETINYFEHIYNHLKSSVDHFVLLPHTAKGRAGPVDLAVGPLFEMIEKIGIDQIAFGANFFKFLKPHQKTLDVSLYDPESMSKYLDMTDMKIYPSSFSDVDLSPHKGAM